MENTIAQELKNNSPENNFDLLDVAENIAVDQDQDWDHEETTFTFKDGSRLVVAYNRVEAS